MMESHLLFITPCNTFVYCNQLETIHRDLLWSHGLFGTSVCKDGLCTGHDVQCAFNKQVNVYGYLDNAQIYSWKALLKQLALRSQCPEVSAHFYYGVGGFVYVLRYSTSSDAISLLKGMVKDKRYHDMDDLEAGRPHFQLKRYIAAFRDIDILEHA
jgi:hypothetical protein